MEDKELQVFVETTMQYFEQVSGENAAVDAPYLKDEDDVVLEYTGVIGVSGRSKGALYYTANSDLLKELIKASGGTEEDAADEEMLRDMAGEVANILSGNARKAFGSNFMISVPVIVTRTEGIKLPSSIKTFVIRVWWRKMRSYLIVCIEMRDD